MPTLFPKVRGYAVAVVVVILFAMGLVATWALGPIRQGSAQIHKAFAAETRRFYGLQNFEVLPRVAWLGKTNWESPVEVKIGPWAFTNFVDGANEFSFGAEISLSRFGPSNEDPLANRPLTPFLVVRAVGLFSNEQKPVTNVAVFARETNSSLSLERPYRRVFQYLQ